jgi:hypothetical protein
MFEPTAQPGSSDRHAPHWFLLPVLTAPFAVICITILGPPSATGQYIFYGAAMLFHFVLLPLAAVIIFMSCRALFRRSTYPLYRIFLVGLCSIVISAVVIMSGYRNGPGP